MCLLCLLHYILLWIAQVPCPFLIELFVVLLSYIIGKLYILDISHLSDICIVNIFPHFVACLFIFLTMSFEKQFLILTKSNLSLFSFMVSLLYPIKESSAYPRIAKIFPRFSSRGFIVLAFTFKSTFYF